MDTDRTHTTSQWGRQKEGKQLVWVQLKESGTVIILLGDFSGTIKKAETVHLSFLSQPCAGRESNPDLLFGTQPCWPLHHRRCRLRVSQMPVKCSRMLFRVHSVWGGGAGDVQHRIRGESKWIELSRIASHEQLLVAYQQLWWGPKLVVSL